MIATKSIRLKRGCSSSDYYTIKITLIRSLR
jgi:hypothetical protein